LSTSTKKAFACVGDALQTIDSYAMKNNQTGIDLKLLFCALIAACWCPITMAQNVGIGEAFPQAKLHVDGALRIDGDSITGDLDKPATILHLLANGGVSIKLDANDDGSERFTVKRSGIDLGSVVLEVTEAGNTTATGFGDFNGYGRFNGNLTLDGDSRDFVVGENFDLLGDGSVEIYLDADGDNASADFAVLDDAGRLLLLVQEDVVPTVYSAGTGAGETGGIRMRELAANGSNWVGLRVPDAVGGNVWLTLPGTDGAVGQWLQTDGSGVLSWADPPAMRSARWPAPIEHRWRSGDTSRIMLRPAHHCRLEGWSREDRALPAKGMCRLERPSGPGEPWYLAGACTGGCARLSCRVACGD
jgi:hypothetical protein